METDSVYSMDFLPPNISWGQESGYNLKIVLPKYKGFDFTLKAGKNNTKFTFFLNTYIT